MDDESYFTLEGNEWQEQSYYESENHPASADVKFIRKTRLTAKVLLWLAVSEYDGNQYFSSPALLSIRNCQPELHKLKHHKKEKIVF
jgi:hypothetical protein